MHYISFEETINRIHEAGGLAFLAHPLLYPYENNDKFDEIDKIFEAFEKSGVNILKDDDLEEPDIGDLNEVEEKVSKNDITIDSNGGMRRVPERITHPGEDGR